MVAGRSANWLLPVLLFANQAFAGVHQASRPVAEEQRYYAEFHPDLKPWKPAEERNLEEVFKNYQYYAISENPAEHTLIVTHYRQGNIVDIARYRVQPDGALQLVKREVAPGAGRSVDTPVTLYATHCAGCHGGTRLGGSGPALLPSNLGRLSREAAEGVIRDGRIATQMPGFGDRLTTAELRSLVEFIYTQPAVMPVWDERAIRASQRVMYPPGSLPDKPVFDADPLNLFTVVEAGDHHVTVLDGDRLEPIHRFPTRFALHGGLKYSPDGRYVYLASRDGWITKFDLYNLKTVAEVRAGINSRNVAVSADGATLLVGNYLPRSLVLLKADDLSLLKVIPVTDSDGNSSRVSAVYQAAPRDSFVIALKDVPEIWEISTDRPDFPVRRIRLERVLDDFFFDQSYRYLIGADRAQNGGQVINLDSGRQVAELPLDGMPHLGSGITWQYRGREVMATPDLKDGVVTVIDMGNWQVIKRIKTLGPGFFMRSHENTPYAWTDVFFGPDRDAIQVIDKRSLEIVGTLRPETGKTSAHVEFTRDGRFALVSLWEMEGALVVYDASTLEEVKRIPMHKPSGKYNVYNKINRSAGTSH
jgi:hypothetical protein